MGAPLILSENLFSVQQFPNHVISATEEPSGNEAQNVADSRRESTSWTMSTANTDGAVKTVCNRVRGANVLVIDRAGNLGGYAVKLQASQDNYTTIDTAVDITLPSVSSPLPLDNTTGVRLEDGSWAILFGFRAATYWRVLVPQMGAGLKPVITGLYLGLAYEPGDFWKPAAEDMHELVGRETVTPAGWRGRTKVERMRSDTMSLKLADFHAYDQARYHLDGWFGSGYPTWIWYDRSQGDRGVCAVSPLGRMGFRFSEGGDWGYQQAQLQWVEHEPVGL